MQCSGCWKFSPELPVEVSLPNKYPRKFSFSCCFWSSPLHRRAARQSCGQPGSKWHSQVTVVLLGCFSVLILIWLYPQSWLRTSLLGEAGMGKLGFQRFPEWDACHLSRGSRELAIWNCPWARVCVLLREVMLHLCNWLKTASA